MMNEGLKKHSFAIMDKEKLRALAKEGGSTAPPENRTFSTNRKLASEAGRKGGRSSKPEQRTFYLNRELARQAGRKGGKTRKLPMKESTDGQGSPQPKV